MDTSSSDDKLYIVESILKKRIRKVIYFSTVGKYLLEINRIIFTHVDFILFIGTGGISCEVERVESQVCIFVSFMMSVT